jgi:E3 ubiquitin-protein ligase synoviolin
VLDEGTDTRAAAAGGQRQNALLDRQQENVLGPQAQVNNAQNGNNPLGFLGRLFGPANRLPNVADRQAVQNNQGQQPGIFINYQVQYRFPERRNEGDLQVQQQQQLPPYPGFQGPGGAWQPWPGEGAAQPQTTTAENSQTDRPASESQVDTPSPTQGPLESSDGAALPAREAARQAALRRFGSLQEIKDNPNGSAPTTSTSNVVDPPPQASAPTNDMSIGSSPPQLIPLFNFDLHAQTPFVPPPSVLQSATSPIAPETNLNHLPTGDLGSSTTSGDPSATLQQLPQSLTEEQLARLDMLTRESIDERLRILESVSATIHRCVDDLLRLRSALPVLDLPSTTGASGSPSPSSTISAEDQDGATQSDKGKEKEKVADDPISELPKAQSAQLNE